MLEQSVSAIPSSIWDSMISWFTPTVLFVLLNLMIGTIAFTSTLSNHKHNHQQHHNDHNIARSPSLLHRLKSINLRSHHHRSQEPHHSSPDRKPIPDSDAALFAGEHSYQANHLETQSHYFFQDPSSQENTQTETHYVFEQTHEPNPQPTQAHFDFDQKDSNFNDFEQLQEEKERVEEENEITLDEVYTQVTGSHFSRTKSDTEPSSGNFPAKLPTRMRKSASLKSAFGHFEEEDIVEARRPATVKEKGSAKVTDGDAEVDAKADDFINRFKQQLKLQRLDSIIRYKDMIGRGSGGGR